MVALSRNRAEIAIHDLALLLLFLEPAIVSFAQSLTLCSVCSQHGPAVLRTFILPPFPLFLPNPAVNMEVEDYSPSCTMWQGHIYTLTHRTWTKHVLSSHFMIYNSTARSHSASTIQKPSSLCLSSILQSRPGRQDHLRYCMYKSMKVHASFTIPK